MPNEKIAIWFDRDTHALVASHAEGSGTSITSAADALVKAAIRRERAWRSCREKRRTAGKE